MHKHRRKRQRLVVGQINTLVDPIAYISSVSNTTASTGGTDTEDDENYRERIQLAPESFSVAGSEGAYIYWARSAHQASSTSPFSVPTAPRTKAASTPSPRARCTSSRCLRAASCRTRP